MDRDVQRTLNIVHVCEGPREFAHLADERRYAPGDVGAGLCQGIHQGIDGTRVGGKPKWYVDLGHLGQRTLRLRLAGRARRAWELLTPEERAEWERKAAAWLASLKETR